MPWHSCPYKMTGNKTDDNILVKKDSSDGKIKRLAES
jgi:hypothetical protein